jgi:hypothetical protein
MRAIAAWATIGVMVMMPAHPGAQSLPTLVVRLYNTSAIPTAELLSAHSAAESILRDAGLDVVFRHCGLAAPPAERLDRCDEPLKPGEVVVRVITAPAFNASLRADAYGVAYIIRDTNRGWLATVFSDRIDEAAVRVSVDPGTLLGRVMAHEVGHLLLGVDYHSAAGLMVSAWPDAALTRTSDAWRFSTLEAARLHDALPTETISHQ